MYKKIIISISLVVIILISFIACIEIQKPTINYENYEVTQMNYDQTKINFIFGISNPNPISLENAFYKYKLEINNEEFIQSNDTQFSLLAGKITKIYLPVELKYKNVFRAGTSFFDSLANGHESLPYKISGEFKFNFIAFPITIPFSHEGSIPLPKLPKISLDSVKMRSIGFSDVQFNINMRVSNQNDFPFLMNKLLYNFKLGDKVFATGIADSNESISGNGQKAFSLVINVNPMTLGQSVLSAIQNGAIDYQLFGSMNTDGIDIPFDLFGKVAK